MNLECGWGLCELKDLPLQFRVPAALSNPLTLPSPSPSSGIRQPSPLGPDQSSPLLCVWGHSGGGKLGRWDGVTTKFLPWGGGRSGVMKVRLLLAKTTEVVPAAEQLEGDVCFPSAA